MTRASELRDAFDRGFAVAERPADPRHRDLLCLRAGGEPCAVLLDDVASLHGDLRIVPLPSRSPALLGVAAIRAAILPIYDLGAALGLAGVGAGTARWGIVLRGGAAGFAFAGYDGHARIPDAAYAAAGQRGRTRGQFRHAGQLVPVVDLAALAAAIEAGGGAGPAKEP